ncbi:transglutaminase [Aureimonas sp. Leaf454]|uniref:transglutaminase-like domain-containing protein n=1 Tax=Aureimonas sp. Leaf454 TaxID=1736381 RepID=UPI000701C4F9|nr:transglutaminase family protein [Aureimonas sp. Leaf454]KQT54660.1 transglutaminase [Aureimonas sp. Leaf454]
MRMRLGCELNYNFSVPTPMIVMLNVHYSRTSDLEHPDHLKVDPSVPVWSYRDSFGNWCCRLVAPVGPFSLGTDAVIRDSGEPDARDPYAIQHPVEDLPPDALQYLLGSRYCETDLLMDEAWRLFGHTAPDASRVQAIVDFVHNHIAFNYNDARNTRTASEAYAEGRGVCRDFTHLAVAFCRCMNIPTKYCTGYISDVGLPPPYATMDFAAWMEVYLGGRWHVFDPRNNQARQGRVLVAQGRDAADVPLTHTFGSNRLTGFKVWIDKISD